MQNTMVGEGGGDVWKGWMWKKSGEKGEKYKKGKEKRRKIT